MTRVLIVAPYASVRAGLQALLADRADGPLPEEPIGAISGSAELERLLPDARPDVVLLDDTAGEGAQVVELLAGGETGLVLLAEGGHPIATLAGASLPGWACLLKEADAEAIAAAVRAVAAGLIVLDPSLAPRPTASPALGHTALLPDERLTAREREVLRLVADGLQNRQIAARLHISPHTAKFHVASILAKLGAASRTEAVTLAARRGDLVL